MTLGYLSPTLGSPFPESIPYGAYLQEWMGARGHVLVRGVCGETTQDMRVRFHKDVLSHSPHVAIILGGTNDLGLGMTLNLIMENLQFFYDQTQAKEILPVAVTIPSLRYERWEMTEVEEGAKSEISPAIQQAIDLRVVLNQSLKDFCEERHIPVVDWFTETCELKTQLLTSEYSNDGLHLTTAGYRRLAEMLWMQVLEDVLKKPTTF